MDFAPMLSAQYWRKLATKWSHNWNYSELFCDRQASTGDANCASEFPFFR
jgi:hypothetical protein